MKCKVLLIALCLVVLASCRKSELVDAPLNTGEKVKVKFSVVQRSDATASDVADSATRLINLVNQLTYVVYAVDTEAEVARQTQFNTDPQFGQISLELQKGEYNFVVIGSKASFGVNQFFWQDGAPPVVVNFSDAFVEYRQQSEIGWEKHYKTDDTFGSITRVEITDPQPETELEIRRIVGKLEVAVEDVDDYWVEVKNESTKYQFVNQLPGGRVNEGLLILKSSKGFVSVYILQTYELLHLVIGYGDSIDEQRELYVPIERNKRTVVKGKLLKPVTNGFHIDIQEEWIRESHVVEF